MFDVGVVMGWCFEIDVDLEVGIRVGLKFKFLLKFVREIFCRGECFCFELFDLFVMLEKIVDMLD